MLKTMHTLGMLLFFVLLCLSVGQLGVFFTTETTFQWYGALHKPLWTPPNFIFPLVWTLLYVMMAIAAWLVWRAKKPGYPRALLGWGAQLFLNALWTPIFFGHQEIFYGLVIIAVLWLFIFITTVLFFKHSKIASFLMFIYLVWVSYASVLNFMLWQMNR